MTIESPAVGGYLRMPSAWMKRRMSPGAKVLLAHFCGAADDHGASWYSYADLTEIVCRSKAAISGYVKELREQGYIRTQEQTYGNGYNYRLKIYVVGWSDIIQAWADQRAAKIRKATAHAVDKTPSKVHAPSPDAVSAVQETERPVQPGERNDPKGHKTQIHKTHTTAPAVARVVSDMRRSTTCESVWSDRNEHEWKKFRPDDKADFGTFGPLPPSTLIDRLEHSIRHMTSRLGVIARDDRARLIADKTREFIARRKISSSKDDRDGFEAAICEKCVTTHEINAVFEELEKIWRPNWRGLSNPDQVRKLCASPEVSRFAPSTENLVFLTRQKSRMTRFLHTYRKVEGRPYADASCDR